MFIRVISLCALLGFAGCSSLRDLPIRGSSTLARSEMSLKEYHNEEHFDYWRVQSGVEVELEDGHRIGVLYRNRHDTGDDSEYGVWVTWTIPIK